MKEARQTGIFAKACLLLFGALSMAPGWLAAGEVGDHSKISATLARYYTAAREYDQQELLMLISRRRLESAIRPVLVSSTDIARLDSVATLFQYEALSASVCQLFLIDVSESEGIVNVAVVGRGSRDSSDRGKAFHVLMIEEQGMLRVDRRTRVQDHDIVLDNQELVFDICDTPISGSNPAIGYKN